MATMTEKQTPMMKQYLAAKAKFRDAILFFRMGDFYEMFYEDAKTASRVLGLTLTSRAKDEQAVPMAGVPHHAVDGYLRRLIQAGFRVAICDQMEDPRQAKGLVKREVTRLVTPGTLTDEALLPERKSNYLAALAVTRDPPAVGLAWVELSTGAFEAMDCPPERCLDELARLDPAEVLVPEALVADPLVKAVGELVRTPPVKRPDWNFDRDGAVRALTEHFGTATLEGFGCADLVGGLSAAGAILVYLAETQKTSLAHIARLTRVTLGDRLFLDQTTQASLELVKPLRPKSAGGPDTTLLGILDRTETPMGARLMREWLLAPLARIDAIEARLDAVGEFVRDAAFRDGLRQALSGVSDLERIATRVSTGRSNARDLVALDRSIRVLPVIKARGNARKAPLLAQLEAQVDLLEDVHALIAAAIADDPPTHLNEGGLIRPGYRAELDQLRDIASGGKQWLARFEAAERERTAIPSLKVGFNNVFGYYIEVTNAHAQRVPAEYTRKQTLKNAERYITPELKEHETQVLTAQERAQVLEYELFVQVRDEVARHTARIQATAAALAALDCLSTLAVVAVARNYCRPRLVEAPVLTIVDGRHPVLEAALQDEPFVPNDTYLGGEEGRMMVITGPNMAGKSTYIRQVALIAILAQMGAYVPAREAELGLVDRIFTRVGATDQIVRGMSTFMIEMTETAAILNNATDRSLIILDEVGRGTSTFDGLAIAWAVTEYIHARIQARTLFATHYHEITELAAVLEGVRNYNVAVREWGDQVVFLHKIVPGGTDQSYGIHVARLAGVPREVIDRAREVLAQLDEIALDAEGKPRLAGEKGKPRSRKPREIQLALFGTPPHPVIDELRKLDVDRLTPLDALRVLKDLKDRTR
jgi:DNA mismatch repair protein MutS